MQIRFIQTKVYHRMFYSVSKETTHESSKVAAVNKLFLQCVCYWCHLLRWMFFTLCDNWKTLFFKNCICYLRYNFTILMSTFQNKPDLKLILIFENCFRSSYRSCSLKKDVHNFFSKFTRKHLCRVSFLIKLQKALAIKKETLAQVLFCEFCEIFKNTFFKDHLRTTTSRVSCSFILWLDLFFLSN